MKEEPCGVLIVDKPGGMTSHDVVGRARRKLGTKRVGHAGTLDPMATGVLVVLVGEATKLASHLTAQDKRYLARVTFGASTDTLDADGTVVATAPVSAELSAELEAPSAQGALARAISAEVARTEQIPPAHSAIHVDGQRSYDRARKGEIVELPARSISVRSLRVVGGSRDHVDLELDVSKGYYVRSLARDLGERLGTPAHLSMLRRLASGPFDIARAVALDAANEELAARLVPMAEAVVAALPHGVLTSDGVTRARQGKSLSLEHFTEPPPIAPSAAWLDADGKLVAIGTRVDDALTVQRGFVG